MPPDMVEVTIHHTLPAMPYFLMLSNWPEEPNTFWPESAKDTGDNCGWWNGLMAKSAGKFAGSPVRVATTNDWPLLLFFVLIDVGHVSTVQAHKACTAADAFWCCIGRCIGRLFQQCVSTMIILLYALAAEFFPALCIL
jgi:hypothetical protein